VDFAFSQYKNDDHAINTLALHVDQAGVVGLDPLLTATLRDIDVAMNAGGKKDGGVYVDFKKTYGATGREMKTLGGSVFLAHDKRIQIAASVEHAELAVSELLHL
jgi:hypothetical protein